MHVRVRSGRESRCSCAVQLADAACEAGGREPRGGLHQRALDLVGCPARVAREDLGRSASDHRGGKRRAGHPHVAGRDDTVGSSCREGRGHRDRRGDPAAGRGDLRLREAVERVAEGRPRCGKIVVRVGGAVGVERADGDHERVVARRILHLHRGARAVVADRCDDGDAAEPQLLDRRVERVVAEARGRARPHREVGDTNVVLRPVLQDPVDRCDHVALRGGTSRIGGTEVDDRRVRCDARVEAGTRGDPGDHRAVTFVVAGCERVRGLEVDARDDARAEVRKLGRVDPAVHDRDRRRGRSRKQRSPGERQDVRRGLPQRRLLEAGRPHLRVDDDREDVVVLRKLEERTARQLTGDAVHRVELALQVAEPASLVERRRDARARLAGAAAHDHPEDLGRARRRALDEGGRDERALVRRIRGARKRRRCERAGERQEGGDSDQQTTGADLSALATGTPKGAGANPVHTAVVVHVPPISASGRSAVLRRSVVADAGVRPPPEG